MEDKGKKRIRKIRIGIDGHMIGDNSGGNESYYKNILQAMDIPSDWDVFLFLKPGVDAEPYKKFKIIRFKSSNAAVRNFIELPTITRSLKLDLLHTQYFIPFIRSCPIVVTIHDICFEHYKDIFTKGEYVRQKLLVPYAARKSRAVFTVSEFSKKDIAKKYKISPDRILVTHNAVGESFRRLNETELREAELRKQFGIGKDPYILTVGNLQPRKNLPRLIEAFKKLRSDGVEYKLVIVGKKAWMYYEILTSASDENIILTDYVSETDLVGLYNAAELFVYPSFFEGFGLPPLEAMACGTPVAVSKATSLTEVVEGAGQYFDPFDVDSIKKAIEQVINDRSLQTRLINRGLEQVNKFSWKQSAQLVCDTYKKVLEHKA